jgi:transcriptional regulator with XRE-family HTH domain
VNVAAVLREARDRAGLTQAALAAAAGTSQATVSAYESGRKTPSVTTLDRLLAASGMRLRATASTARRPSATELERTARTLRDVLDLAAALPARHERELRYPRLPASRAA